MRHEGGRSRPTIHDVAATAGVSVTTVSHVLNGYRDVGATTRQLVHRVVRDLGYSPRSTARGLRLRQTWLVGVVLPSVTVSFYHELLQAIEDAADSAGYGVVLFTSRGDPEREQRALEVLQQKEVDGIILASVQTDQRTFSAVTGSVRCPLVLVTPSLSADIPAAIPDPYEGVLAAYHHLLDLGHRHILCLTGPDIMLPWYIQRRDAAAATILADQQGRVRVEKVRAAETAEHGYQAMHAYLQQGGTATAILAYSDVVAAGALRAIQEAGLRVPDDISVVGCDDMMRELCAPPLTSVLPPKAELGHAAITLLFEQMQGKRKRSLVLPTSLMVRASTHRPLVGALRAGS
jgi:LacI family transcriptional regulator